MKEIYGIIYKITNLINNKVYIGQTTKTFNERYSYKGKGIERVYAYHKQHKKVGNYYNEHLLFSIDKYGFDAFEVVEVFDTALSKNELDEKEKYWIDYYNSTDGDFGYNNKEGGEGNIVLDRTVEKIKETRRRNNRNILNDSDVRKIKLALICLINRKQLAKMFGVTVGTIDRISQLKIYSEICSELNEQIKGLKNDLIKERNKEILKLFDNGSTISEISKTMNLSTSIVEKCVYKYRDVVEQGIKKRQKIYDEVMKLYNEGMSPYQISKKLKIGSTTVHRYVKGESNPYIELPYKKIKSEDIPIIVDLYFKKNKTIYEISNKFKVSKNTIESIILHYKHVNTEVS